MSLHSLSHQLPVQPRFSLLVPCPSTWYFLAPSVTSSGPISIVISEPYVSLIAPEWFCSFPGSFSSEIQGPSCIFSESSPFRAVYFYIRYDSYSGWVPHSASGEIQHARERSPPLMQLLWMFWLQQQQLQAHHHHSSEVVRFLFYFCIVSALSTAY